MLGRISKSSIQCREEAIIAKVRAARAPSPELQREHDRLAEKWTDLADIFDEAARVSGYLEWTSQRLRD